MAVPRSDAFFADVRRLFALLDLDGDGLVEHAEAVLGLTHCFDAVHAVHSPRSHSSPEDAPPVSAQQKAQTVANQVGWLFSATQHAAASPSSLPSPLPLSDFELCYQRLLQSAYEQEVLHLDLKRAIDALSSSQQWAAMSRLLTRARRLWRERIRGDGEGAARAIERSTRALATGEGAGFASAKKSAAVRRVVDALKAKGSAVSEDEWMAAWHEVVAVEFNHDRVSQDIDSALTDSNA